MDVGNFTYTTTRTGKLKTDFLFQVMSEMNYDLINIGARDIQNGLDFLHRLQKNYQIPLLSANVIDNKTGKESFAPFIIRKFDNFKVGVIGILAEYAVFPSDSLNKEMTIKPAIETAQRTVKKLKPKCDIIIMLAAMDYTEGKRLIQNVPGIDVLITGHNALRSHKAVKFEDTILLQANYQGQDVGDLTLVLDNKRNIKAFEDRTTSLDQTIGEDKKIAEICNRLNDVMEVNGTEKPKHISSLLKKQKMTDYYIGEKICRDCHQQEDQHWQKTTHARAFSRLEQNRSTNDSTCTPCHTTGFRRSNGFRNLRSSPHLVGVQCESCHGPGFRHAKTHQRAKETGIALTGVVEQIVNNFEKVNDKLCRKCHTIKRDPDFDYDKALTKVKH